MPTKQGSIRLFQFAGVTVYLHWFWFVVAIYEINDRAHEYSSAAWCALEYIALFAIVLVHEFGHALACRSVGGKAEQIILWPLGGVAFVSPPPRPGATLWSIAAGPLVNVVLAPILGCLWYLGYSWGLAESAPNAYGLVRAVFTINCVLLIFNLLPIYPLDGGQILCSLLWFVLGRARALLVSTIIGFVGVAGLLGLAWLWHSWWTVIMAGFVLLCCWRGLLQARLLAKVARLPRRADFVCPACKLSPPRGAFWRCTKCLKPFDTFESRAVCPHCGTQFPVTQCLDCGRAHPFPEWTAAPPLPTVSVSPPGVR